jgi:hypothetical protein
MELSQRPNQPESMGAAEGMEVRRSCFAWRLVVEGCDPGQTVEWHLCWLLVSAVVLR